MRIILVVLFLVIFFILSIPIFLVESIIGKVNPRLKVKSSQAIVVGAFRVVLFISGAKRTVIGVENVPKDTAVLYVSNHKSYFDIPLAYTTLPTLTGFIAKKEIGKVPFLRVWMRYINCLFLDRSDLRQGLKTILKGIDLVKDGYSVFISPEGTRNHEKILLPFKEGSFKIAEKTGCPIIPVAINNTDAGFELHAPWIRKAHFCIEYGKPIYLEDLDKEQRKFLGEYVRGIIQKMYDHNETLI